MDDLLSKIDRSFGDLAQDISDISLKISEVDDRIGRLTGEIRRTNTEIQNIRFMVNWLFIGALIIPSASWIFLAVF